MAENLGFKVSTVNGAEGYNFDTVVIQKETPALDSELNNLQENANILNRRNLSHLPSGWLKVKPPYTSTTLAANSFYTQDPSSPDPEYATVNGWVLYVTNTSTPIINANLVQLLAPPQTGNMVNGVILEVWRALLDPNTDTNKPASTSVTDPVNSIYMYNTQIGWMVGSNGLIINTRTGGDSWNTQVSGVSNNFRAVDFANQYVGWAVGDGGCILRTASGGSSWTPLTTGVSENIYGISSFSQLIAWAVGASGLVLKTQNGIAWTKVNAGILVDLYSVFFFDNLVGWAVGDNGAIYKTTDGGTVWNPKVSGTTNALKSVSFSTLLSGVAVGVDGTILSTCNGGETWTSQSSNIYNGAYSSISNGLNSVTMFSENVGWICGTGGLILKTIDGGAQWISKPSGQSYDLNSIFFSDQNIGWAAGYFSLILKTMDTGNTWAQQQSNVLSRVQHRIFYEGNVLCDSSMYLDDNSIHPQVNVETSKRVQIQYRIRVIDSIDPLVYPDAGLGSPSSFSQGPNSTELDAGNYPYENMGETTGDNSLWKARCNNTVDGYSWAIPMFVINRRNSTSYNITANPNGTTVYSTGTVRLDQLVSTMVSDVDILDVRRKVIASSSELFLSGFEALSGNTLSTKLERKSLNGDRYGVKMLQVDRLGAATDGDAITGTMTDLINGNIKAGVIQGSQVQSVSVPDLASIPVSIALPVLPAYQAYHQNSVYYQAVYADTNPLDPYIGQKIPGYFSGIGTANVTFYVGAGSHYGTESPNAASIQYQVSAIYVDYSSRGLTRIPSDPKLVKTFRNSSPSTSTVYFRGLRNDVASSVVDLWSSPGSIGYYDYVVAYPGSDDNATQRTRASCLEIHCFRKTTSTSRDVPFLKNIPLTDSPTPSGYSTYAIKKILNASEGFSYKLSYITDNTPSTGYFTITTDTAYPILANTIIEVVAYALFYDGSSAPNLGLTADLGDTLESIRNGNAVNLTPSLKQVYPFFSSPIKEYGDPNNPGQPFTPVQVAGGVITIPVLNGIAIGLPAMETVTSLNQYYCWIKPPSFSTYVSIRVSNVSGWGTSTLLLTLDNTDNASIRGNPYTQFTTNGGFLAVQILTKMTSFYTISGQTTDSAVIGYNYNPYQTPDLPSTLTIEPVIWDSSISISNEGVGSTDGLPYETPIEHIPTNDPTIISDGYFYNMESLQFNNFKVDSGYVRMPAYVPPSLGTELIFSSPSADAQGRTFYSVCSRDITAITEALRVASPRKIYFPVLGKVKSSSNLFRKGEYVLAVFSRSEKMVTNNQAGTGTSGAVAIYRLPNKPLTRA